MVTINGEQDVDHNNCFGGHGLPRIYISFQGLVTWITRNVKFIVNFWIYMDNFFEIDEGNMTWYQPYEKCMPANQVKLLSLWDELRIPHEPHKQLFGEKLTIIHIEVNTNNLTFMLSKQALPGNSRDLQSSLWRRRELWEHFIIGNN